MGYYINPENMTKKAWLDVNGKAISEQDAKKYDASGDSLVVCLVDNGAFYAAGIAYNNRELDAFLHPDAQPKWFYLVPRERLLPWYNPKEHG